MSERKYSYDEECERLARHFLADHIPTNEMVRDLAQRLQEAVEEWFDLRPEINRE